MEEETVTQRKRAKGESTKKPQIYNDASDTKTVVTEITKSSWFIWSIIVLVFILAAGFALFWAFHMISVYIHNTRSVVCSDYLASTIPGSIRRYFKCHIEHEKYD